MEWPTVVGEGTCWPVLGQGGRPGQGTFVVLRGRLLVYMWPPLVSEEVGQ